MAWLRLWENLVNRCSQSKPVPANQHLRWPGSVHPLRRRYAFLRRPDVEVAHQAKQRVWMQPQGLRRLRVTPVGLLQGLLDQLSFEILQRAIVFGRFPGQIAYL